MLGIFVVLVWSLLVDERGKAEGASENLGKKRSLSRKASIRRRLSGHMAETSAESWLASKGFQTFPFHGGRVQYVALPAHPPSSVSTAAHFFSIDTELIYWNFFLDFGPLNLGQLNRFCQKLNSALANPRLNGKTIYFYRYDLSVFR